MELGIKEVSSCAFIGSLFSGWIANGVRHKRSFQLCALPMLTGAGMSATAKSPWGMLLGGLFVGIGMRLGPPVAALYVAEVSPTAVRGTFGGLTQIATCLGLMGALFIGFPAKEIVGWWWICFWVSVILAAILALFMEISAESPHWLLKRGRAIEVEAELEKLLGRINVKLVMVELSKSDRAVFEIFGVPSDLANTSVGICNLLGSVFATILMYKLGRKVLLLGSFLGMESTMAISLLKQCYKVPNLPPSYACSKHAN